MLGVRRGICNEGAEKIIDKKKRNEKFLPASFLYEFSKLELNKLEFIKVRQSDDVLLFFKDCLVLNMSVTG